MSDWICLAWKLSQGSKDRIRGWVWEQTWPLSVELTDPDGYHVTALYSRSGFGNQDLQEWVNSRPVVPQTAQTLDCASFSPGDGREDIPLVLRFKSQSLIDSSSALTSKLQNSFAIESVIHPEGYQPHLTFAKINPNGGEFALPKPPPLEIILCRLIEIHKLKSSKGNTQKTA
jgi:hypothetical protein